MDDKVERISLSEIIRVLLKRKKLIAIVTVAFLAIVLLESFVLTETKYKSEVTLEINNIETTPSKASDNSDMYNKLENITQAGDMDFETYLDEVVSEEVLENTIEDLDIGDTYNVSGLRSDLSVDSDEENKTIKLKLLSDNHEQGNEIVSKITEEFKAHITKLSQENSQRALEIMRNQMEVEKDKFEQVLKEYKDEAEKIKSPHELELEIDSVYDKMTDYKMNINDLDIRREGILAALEEISSQDSDSGLIMRSSGNTADNVYLDTSKNVLEVDLAETESKITNTKDTIKKLQDNMGELQVEFHEAELAQSSIVQKLDLTKDSYKAFSKKYEELDMEDSIDIGEITINVVPKIESSSKPIGRSTTSKLVVGLVLGIMTGIIISLFMEYIDIVRAKNILEK